MQQQPAAGSPELTLGQLRPVAPALQHVAAQDQLQPESPAKPLLHHSEFVAPQVSERSLCQIVRALQCKAADPDCRVPSPAS